MGNKKFEFTEETKTTQWGTTVKRIVALRDFGDVKTGDKGGFLEKEENLSHGNDCWVYNEAQVYDEAQVFGEAKVYDEAQVYGKSQVCGEALVYDEAQVYGEALVCGEARVTTVVKTF